MSKVQRSNKETKKQAASTLKEKKAAKQAKRETGTIVPWTQCTGA
ncbi:hypothetical protein [Undibacterium sp. TS12]|nr:hypothetical protein [Undibacterium sp. TS12]